MFLTGTQGLIKSLNLRFKFSVMPILVPSEVSTAYIAVVPSKRLKKDEIASVSLNLFRKYCLHNCIFLENLKFASV